MLTAAHCLENIWSDQVFVYYGDNFAADFPQLTQLGDTLVPPPPGSPSVWAQGNSYEKHPQWDPNVIRADMGVIYLDRKLPFDPFPLARFRLDNLGTTSKSRSRVGAQTARRRRRPARALA